MLEDFAALMRAEYGARIYLFGSRARGTSRETSDFDILAVSDRFLRVPISQRAVEAYRLWWAAGGWGLGLDLQCLTEREIERALREPESFFGNVARRHELHPVLPTADRVRTAALLEHARADGVPEGIKVTP